MPALVIGSRVFLPERRPGTVFIRDGCLCYFSEWEAFANLPRCRFHANPNSRGWFGRTGDSPGFTRLATKNDYNLCTNRVNANRQGALSLTCLRKTSFAIARKNSPKFFNFSGSRTPRRLFVHTCSDMARFHSVRSPSLPLPIGSPNPSDLLFLQKLPNLAICRTFERSWAHHVHISGCAGKVRFAFSGVWSMTHKSRRDGVSADSSTAVKC
jgi:hypothetical protein